ncbi:hypothetical protein [Methylomonas sp. AM2-LC]|uniref:hypothetical protein n=1 Tax=Methylomonas sp. AM2-LC TaxID=3153301 RepID=UPI0032645A10
MAYDRQLIIQFLCGDSSDKLITDNAKAINNRAISKGLKSHIVTLPMWNGFFGNITGHFQLKSLKHELSKLTSKSRVYIQGHGDWQSQKVADWTADFSVDFLVGCGLPAVKMVSILACEAGRDLGSANDIRVTNSADSYGSKFHKRMFTKHGLKIEVYARVYCVVPIGPAAQSVFGLDKDQLGRKATSDENDDAMLSQYGRTKSKLRFYWLNGQQVREWAY